MSSARGGTVIIDASRSTHGLLTSITVAAEDESAVLSSLRASAEEACANATGFTGGAWLTRIPDARHDEVPDTARVVEYLQWNSRDGAETLLAGRFQTSRWPGVDAEIAAIDVELYRLGAVISGDRQGRAAIETPGPGAQLLTGIITLTAVTDKQAWIDEYNQSETRDYIQYLDGFVSASFMIAERSQRLSEFVQWRSPADFTAAFADDRFTEHINVADHYSTSQLALYRIQQTLERP